MIYSTLTKLTLISWMLYGLKTVDVNKMHVSW